MASASLHIDLAALQANWRALNRGAETAAVVKANAYGLGAPKVAEALAAAGARRFFVAIAEEGATLRTHLGTEPEIFVFAGHMAGDAALIRNHHLTPLLNSAEQVARHLEACPGHPFGLQLDSGMNRLGMEEVEWRAVAPAALSHEPKLVMSHLACADDPDETMNAAQLETFLAMTAGIDAPRSIAATGGILLGERYHLDLTRPGIGLYGGLPFAEAQPVVRLSVPVIQTRTVAPGEAVGYGRAWTAETPARIATLSAGYADGLIRAMGGRARLWAGDIPCPLAGRVSMDLLTVDVTHLDEVPDHLDILGPHQTVDTLAEAAGTIGYEILTALGARYDRRYSGGTS